MYISDSFCAGCQNMQYEFGYGYMCKVLRTNFISVMKEKCGGRLKDPQVSE